MSLSIGIVGLPNVGKSTLFNAITNSQVEAANYPFATIEPNVGIVNVPDERIDEIAKLVNPKKIIPTIIKFTDIAGLVKGASKGEGLGNKFLANIRETDAIVQVVRCFHNTDITHVSDVIDPIDDIEVINLEMILADMEVIKNVISRTERKAKMTNDKTIKSEYDVSKKIFDALEKGNPVRSLDLDEAELKIIKSYNLLTIKPILYVGNIDEECASNPESSPLFQKVIDIAKTHGANALGISIKIEEEISKLDDELKKQFLDDMNIKESGLNILIKNAYKLLELQTFFTAGKEEVRAWTFKKKYTAPQCAGVIHTDFEKGFIRAEVIAYNNYIEYGGEQGAKDAGKMRLEGKEYIVNDGDICHFRFNI